LTGPVSDPLQLFRKCGLGLRQFRPHVVGGDTLCDIGDGGGGWCPHRDTPTTPSDSGTLRHGHCCPGTPSSAPAGGPGTHPSGQLFEAECLLAGFWRKLCIDRYSAIRSESRQPPPLLDGGTRIGFFILRLAEDLIGISPRPSRPPFTLVPGKSRCESEQIALARDAAGRHCFVGARVGDRRCHGWDRARRSHLRRCDSYSATLPVTSGWFVPVAFTCCVFDQCPPPEPLAVNATASTSPLVEH